MSNKVAIIGYSGAGLIEAKRRLSERGIELIEAGQEIKEAAEKVSESMSKINISLESLKQSDLPKKGSKYHK